MKNFIILLLLYRIDFVIYPSTSLASFFLQMAKFILVITQKKVNYRITIIKNYYNHQNRLYLFLFTLLRISLHNYIVFFVCWKMYSQFNFMPIFIFLQNFLDLIFITSKICLILNLFNTLLNLCDLIFTLFQ